MLGERAVGGVHTSAYYITATGGHWAVFKFVEAGAGSKWRPTGAGWRPDRRSETRGGGGMS